MEVQVDNIYTLKLSEDEAKWLHAVMQNPLCGLLPNEEGLECRIMRKKFFDGLDNIIL